MCLCLNYESRQDRPRGSVADLTLLGFPYDQQYENERDDFHSERLLWHSTQVQHRVVRITELPQIKHIRQRHKGEWLPYYRIESSTQSLLWYHANIHTKTFQRVLESSSPVNILSDGEYGFMALEGRS